MNQEAEPTDPRVEVLWENHRYEGRFAIDLPKATFVTLLDESTLAVFSLRRLFPRTERRAMN